MTFRVHRIVRRCKKLVFSLLFWSIVSCFTLGFMLVLYPHRNRGIGTGNGKEEDIIIDLSNNYFPSHLDFTSGDFIINNPKCKVPDIDIWDPQTRQLFEKPVPPKCNESIKITAVKNSIVVLNYEEVKKLGYDPEDISCCYRTIDRVSQKKTEFTREADNLYRYSKECYQMQKETRPKSGFIQVSCKLNTLIPLSSKLYEQFHAVPVFPEEATDSTKNTLSSKLAFWSRKKGNKALPPNILVIGIDSTSRFNFNRLMHETIGTLRNVIEAEEMKGYVKVGENTFPNFVPFMTSLSEGELTKLCYSTRWVAQDDCPYIWKEFSENKYITVHLEDSPKMAIFNYMKTGFIESPVDIYLRPFMLAAYEHEGGSSFAVDCLGYQRPEELIFNYIDGLTSLAHQRKIPWIVTTWLSDLSHDGMFSAQNMDHILSETLLKLHMKKILDNTILFVMSDHGYRFLKIRSTKSGWYEDKMPALWIKLPPTVRSLRPEWTKGLKQNLMQMITPYDLNYALRDILKSYPVSGATPKMGRTFLNDTPPLRAISPFHTVPSRTCKEAGIPRGYCPCASPVAYTDKVFIKRAAQYFIDYINLQLPNSCVPLRVQSVTAFGTPDKTFVGDTSTKDNITATNGTYPGISVIALRVTPGNFLYEAWLKYDVKTGNFTTAFDILRMNYLDGSESCVTVSGEFVEMEKYCFCKSHYHLLSFVKNIG